MLSTFKPSCGCARLSSQVADLQVSHSPYDFLRVCVIDPSTAFRLECILIWCLSLFAHTLNNAVRVVSFLSDFSLTALKQIEKHVDFRITRQFLL